MTALFALAAFACVSSAVAIHCAFLAYRLSKMVKRVRASSLGLRSIIRERQKLDDARLAIAWNAGWICRKEYDRQMSFEANVEAAKSAAHQVVN